MLRPPPPGSYTLLLQWKILQLREGQAGAQLHSQQTVEPGPRPQPRQTPEPVRLSPWKAGELFLPHLYRNPLLGPLQLVALEFQTN